MSGTTGRELNLAGCNVVVSSDAVTAAFLDLVARTPVDSITGLRGAITDEDDDEEAAEAGGGSSCAGRALEELPPCCASGWLGCKSILSNRAESD